MFERFRVYAALPATDLERAKRFYAEKLGLTPQERADELRYECGDGSAFFVFQTSISRRGQEETSPAGQTWLLGAEATARPRRPGIA
jgi:catechol 2,3-dioxygenase-like lactoylglutathione lyase family enzyme